MSLIVVDIQPEYQNYIPFLREFVAYINKTKQPITFLYNGYDTLGMVTESDYKWWLIENGVDEDVIDSATFYDKGYAFFRNCMDKGIDHDDTVGLVKLMYESGVNDSRDLNEDFWDEYVAQNGGEHLREAMEGSEDCINIPDLMDFLQDYNNITLCGGGIEQCLKEVEIALDALGKKYKVLHQYTYQKGGELLKNGSKISDKIVWQSKTELNQYGKLVTKKYKDWAVLKSYGYQNNSPFTLVRGEEQKLYGHFDTLKEVERYIKIWYQVNPKEFNVGGTMLKNGGNFDGKTFLQFSSHRAREKFGKMGIPHEKYVSTKSWNHYIVVATKDVDKIIEIIKKGVKVVKTKINANDLIRPWEQGGKLTEFKYEIGGL